MTNRTRSPWRTVAMLALAAAIAACGPDLDTTTQGQVPPAASGTDITPVEEPAAHRETASDRAAVRLPARSARSLASPPPQASPTPSPRVERAVAVTGFRPFASVGPVMLLHPSHRVETVAFHESNHEGARQLEVAASAAAAMVLESRDRGTGDRTAADIVADPSGEIRAPVTGRVLRAGTYVLYCRHQDGYVVIEPDSRPGWEVKLLHVTGVRVSAGQRVEAGRTLVADRPTPLPFRSQVDDHTAEPSWPHVHLEVVDTSIPNEPEPGGGC